MFMTHKIFKSTQKENHIQCNQRKISREVSGNPMVALPPPNHEAGGSIFVTLRLGHSGSFLVDENPRSQSNCLRFPHGLDTLISLNL